MPRAQRGGRTDGFERQRMVGHAGHHVQVGDVAAGDDQVVVVHPAELAVLAFVLDLTGGQVNVLNFLSAAENARQQLTQGHDHIHRV